MSCRITRPSNPLHRFLNDSGKKKSDKQTAYSLLRDYFLDLKLLLDSWKIFFEVSMNGASKLQLNVEWWREKIEPESEKYQYQIGRRGVTRLRNS